MNRQSSAPKIDDSTTLPSSIHWEYEIRIIALGNFSANLNFYFWGAEWYSSHTQRLIQLNIKNSLQPSTWKPVYPHLNLQPTVGRAARSQGQHHLQPRKLQLLRFDLDRCSHLNAWLWVGLSGEEMYFLKMVSLSIWSLSPSSLERLLINSTLGTWHPQCSLKTVWLMSSYWV